MNFFDYERVKIANRKRAFLYLLKFHFLIVGFNKIDCIFASLFKKAMTW